MLKRIGLNFRRNCGWTLERLGLFLVLLFFLAVSILMRTVTALVNEELIGASDLYVSVSTQTNNELNKCENLAEAEEHLRQNAALFRTLAAGEGVIYADRPITFSGVLSVSKPCEPGEASLLTGGRAYFVEKSVAEKCKSKLWYAAQDKPDEEAWKKQVWLEEMRLLTNSQMNFQCTCAGTQLEMYLGNVVLTEGRTFTQTEIDQGAPVCVVRKGYGIFENNEFTPISIGDTLPVSVYLLDEDQQTRKAETRELTVIGFYENADPEAIQLSAYLVVPEKQWLELYGFGCGFLEQNRDADYLDGEQFKQVGANAMVFQFDRLDSLEAFIRRLENTPEYGAGSLQYFANVDDTVNMLSEFYGVAESFRSVSAIFGLLAAAFAVTLAVLDAFYRRRELAILQSIGESGGRLTLQFSLETLLLLILGWAAAIPAALRAVRAAIPGLLRQTAPAENPFATLSENIEMVTLDAGRVCERLSYSRQDIIFFALFTLVTVLFCAAAVHICTRRFHVRTLLNH